MFFTVVANINILVVAVTLINKGNHLRGVFNKVVIFFLHYIS